MEVTKCVKPEGWRIVGHNHVSKRIVKLGEEGAIGTGMLGLVMLVSKSWVFNLHLYGTPYFAHIRTFLYRMQSKQQLPDCYDMLILTLYLQQEYTVAGL